ncbi:SLAM family member 9-like [Rhineura floridana]|uniref:SLAM family member 9-like n=1 Tax=Rhineura floridana TaxID=261503 RepID=UPI002AC82EB0|nr:SLAM family member 9-like [Rhineura floridana]
MNVASTSLKILLFKALIISSFGTLSNAAKDPTRHLKGILRGSASFPVTVSPARTVARITWDFYPATGEPYLLGEFRNGKLEQPNLKFEGRLEMANETTLRIKGLEVEDTGIYKVRVRFTTAVVQDHTFHLAVYEPVPTPQICHQEVSNSPGRCNVTLQCQVSGTGGFDVSWRTGNPLRALEDSFDWFHLSDNGRDLRLSWQPTPLDSSFTCLVSNPVDQKNVSFDLLSICQKETQGVQTKLTLGLPAYLTAAFATLIMTRNRRKIFKRMKGGMAFLMPKKKKSSLAPHCSDRSPPEGGDDQARWDRGDSPRTSAPPWKSCPPAMSSPVPVPEDEYDPPQTELLGSRQGLLEPPLRISVEGCSLPLEAASEAHTQSP